MKLSEYPTLASQWHPTRNGDITPDKVGTGYKHVVWWFDPTCGHEWSSRISTRMKNDSGCQVCSGKQVLAGFNDLATTHPDIAAQWHPTRNGDITPSMVTAGSRMKQYWWLGKCEHEWQSNVLNRVHGNGCHQCLGRKKSTPQGFLKDDLTLWAQVDAENNDMSVVTQLRRYSVTPVQWVGHCGHRWSASPASRSSGRGCPICSGNTVEVGVNDLQSVNPTVASQWHPTKNGSRTPSTVTAGSGYKATWVCDAGHEWKAAVSDLTGQHHNGCPYCSGRLAVPGLNDLATKHPGIASQWHPTKNGSRTPITVTAGSGYKAAWVCDKGHEWEATVSNRTGRGSGCPECYATNFVSKAEKELKQHLAQEGFTVRTSVRNIIPGELDLYIPDRKVAVEFNGLYWHSEAAGKTRNYHRDKWSACKQKNIQLIQIWEDDWNRNPDLIKRMLAHKLGGSTAKKIYARTTEVVTVSKQEAQVFLTANHLQGWRTASYYGLQTRAGQLVAVFGVQKAKQNSLEIARYATSMTVVGGFSKLLKHVLALPKYREVAEVLSYSHNDHSDGGVYRANGFELVHTGTPGYSYWKSGWVSRKHRLQFSPSRMRTNDGMMYVEGATERELAELNNLYRVWDSGSSLWRKGIQR